MKILLLGEYSSLHKYLKEGLQELGNISVTLLSNGDGWKEIGGYDGTLYSGNSRWEINTSILRQYKKFSGYDIVQNISTNIFPTLLTKHIINYIRQNNKIVSLTSAGGGYALVKAYLSGTFQYYPYDNYKNSIVFYDRKTFKGRIHIKNDKEVIKNTDIIIPGLYEYAVGYKDNPKVYRCIPYPINTKEITYSDNLIQSKIVFFHGLNNEKIVGTEYIRKAFLRLKSRYPNDVEIIIDGHMPFGKYTEVMKNANVVVDQCCRYGYGINAGLAMAMGKVVMSGARKETLDAFGLSKSPIICTEPDEDRLFRQLCWLLENKKRIPDIGYESRVYVENIHDYVKVAKQYLQAWNSIRK